MNILILSQFAGSSKHGMVFRNYAWAREWVKQGHTATIITSSFAHARSVNPSLPARRIHEEMIDGVRYIWVWGNRYKAQGALGRLFSMALFTLQCFFLPLPLEKHYDVVIASSAHPLTIFPAWRLARRYRAKLVFDIRDLWPLSLMELGGHSARNPVIRIMDWAEKFACRHADLVTAVPHACETYLQQQGLPPGRFLAIGNGFIPEEMQDNPLPQGHRNYLQRLQDRGTFIVGYAGSIGLANAMHFLVAALPNADERIHAVLMGHGACVSDLQEQARQLGISHRVHFLDPVSRDQVPDFLRRVDIAYIGLLNKSIYRFGTSLTKINDYMWSGKPVLYSGNDPGNAVERSGGGLLCPAEDVEALRRTLDKAAAMPADALQAMGQKGRAWVLENQLISKHVQAITRALGLE